MIPDNIIAGMLETAQFYDDRKVGHIGPLGFRRSTDLKRLFAGIDEMANHGIYRPFEMNFMDMGCGDGRVNVLLSYISKKSIGIELDEWILDEASALKHDLEKELEKKDLKSPPDNIYLFKGDSTDIKIYDSVLHETGTGIEDIDLFYTYLTMHDEFADLIAEKARPGALYMVYGLENIVPRYKNFELLTRKKPIQGILAVYRKLG